MSLSWITLSQLSKYKIVQTTIFWLIFIPTTVKITEKLPETITIYSYHISINLPFSWYYLYFSAVFIFSAQLYFKIVSPSIYKENDSFEEFIKKGRNDNQLNKYIQELSNTYVKIDSKDIETLKENFWGIWYEYAYGNHFHRLIISIFYYLGFFFLFFIVMENIIFVTNIFIPIFGESSLYKFYQTLNFY